MVKERDTVGKISLELQEKSKDDNHTPNEQMQEQLKDYEKNIQECINRCKKDYPDDFYIIVITKKERLMNNVIRNYFTGRQSCPTPEYDQIVYKYHRKHDLLEFIWVIPSRDTCEYMTLNALELPADQRDLLNFVLDFNAGALLIRAKKLNGEELVSLT